MKKKYDWVKLFGQGRRFTLVRGRHFECSLASMGQQLRNAACWYGLKIRVRGDGRNRLTVTVQQPNGKERDDA